PITSEAGLTAALLRAAGIVAGCNWVQVLVEQSQNHVSDRKAPFESFPPNSTAPSLPENVTEVSAIMAPLRAGGVVAGGVAIAVHVLPSHTHVSPTVFPDLLMPPNSIAWRAKVLVAQNVNP